VTLQAPLAPPQGHYTAVATEPSVVLEISQAALALALDGAPALAARFFRIVCQARAPPPLRTNRTRPVPHPVLIGHVASLPQRPRPSGADGETFPISCVSSCRPRAAPVEPSLGRAVARRSEEGGGGFTPAFGRETFRTGPALK